MSTSATKLNVHSRAGFVRKSVEENDITKTVIDSIMPYFPKESLVIGGWVDDSKQYWKANFHWEYLLRHLDKAKELDIDAKYKKNIDSIRSSLLGNKPNPAEGYISSRVMGQPKDQSDKSAIIKRWKIVKQAKKDFKKIIDKAGILKGMDKKKQKIWLLAVAPVAKPGTSKHSTGYAVDIAGDNNKIVSISKALGATVVFPEGSHVHVEFAKGVAGKTFTAQQNIKLPSVFDLDSHYTDDACVLSPVELAELKLDICNASTTGLFSEEVPHACIIQDLFNDKLESWNP
ncbi:MAG: D-alanyl-D-alanine carboxypeptidase family protein [Gammaproteobacteria bacterium]|nr:D-alanyl-D-alanine carboxypeptidase family protein [Gammaproteobacteria bacterium]MDH5800014.1 D-alanyl-D-alanine carboxypeptidase family protein [Gammaproteobacteria bacterium]